MAFSEGRPVMRSSWSSSLSAHEMPISMLVSHEASSSARNGGSVRWSMKKKKVLGSLVSRTCGVAIRAKDVIATRSPSQRIVSPSVRRKVIDRFQRSPGMSVTRIDVEPSCSTTRSTPARRTRVVTTCGRASARITQAAAPTRHSQNSSPPKIEKRSRTGTAR